MNRTKTHLAIICAALLVTNIGFSQNNTFQKYSVEEGLSSSRVFTTIEDHLGFVWIATDMGIDRFDGTNFKHYKLPNFKKITEIGFYQFHLEINSKNELWLMTNGGFLYKYSSNLDEFIFHYDLQALQGNKFILESFFIDADDKFWLGTRDGAYIFDVISTNINKIVGVSSGVFSIIQDNRQNFYLGGENGVYVLNKEHNLLYNLFEESPSFKMELKKLDVYSLFIDDKYGRLWMGSSKMGICAFDLTNLEFVQPLNFETYKGGLIRAIKGFSADEIIFGVNGVGLFILDSKNPMSVKHFSSQENAQSELKSNSIFDIYKNKDGLFFISTFRGGLNIYDPNKYNIQSLSQIYGDNNSLENNNVLSIHEISEDILGFGTSKGLSLWNKKWNHWEHLSSLAVKKGILGGFVHAIEVDKNQNIWTASHTDSITRYTPGIKGQYIISDVLPKGYNSGNIRGIYSNNDNLIYFADEQRGLTSYSLSQDSTRHYKLPGLRIVEGISDEKLAIGGSRGFFIYNIDKANLEQHDFIDSSALSDAVVNCIVKSRENLLWVGTSDSGIFIVDLINKSIAQLSIDEGLPSNHVFSIVESESNIWVSTPRGITRIDGENKMINLYKSDGLLSTDFNRNTAIRASDGILYFGTNEGVIFFDPKTIEIKPLHKSIVLTEFYLDQKRILPLEKSPLTKPLNNAESIELNHDQNTFSIDFLSVDYLYQDQGVFQWKLENFEKEWISGQGLFRASYSNLNPGKYTFKLRVVDHNKQLIGIERQFELIINPPFWKTFWAYSIYLIMAIILFGLLSHFYGLWVKSNLFKEKLHYLVDIAHELKTPLMLIKAPLTDIVNNLKIDSSVRQGIDIALLNSGKLNDQITQFLDFKHLSIRKRALIISPLDLVSFLKERIFAFKILADKKNIELSLESDVTDFIINVDERIMEKICSNLISNAVKYTKKDGNIIVKLIVTKKECKILIKDSGIGIPKSQRKKVFQLFYRSPNAKDMDSSGTGVGLVLSSNLAKMLKGKVALEESSPEGSVFSFTFTYQLSELHAIEKAGFNVHNDILIDQGSPSQKVSILIVEDDEDLLKYSKNKLSGAYNVLTASNGFLALNQIEKYKPEIIICDVVMPKMDGLQLCMNIKNNIETCHIPVILFTGLGSKEQIIQGLESGADDYIVKPHDFELLHSKIEVLLRNRQVLKRKFLLYDTSDNEIEFSNELDEEFIQELTQYVEENISDEDLSILDMCESVGMSRTSFYHKLKSLIDISPSEFIRTIRLKRSRSMLLSHTYNVSEVAYAVGFSDAKYFGTLFKKSYGLSPSVFLAQNKKSEVESTNK